MAIETVSDVLNTRGEIYAVLPDGTRLKTRKRMITAMRDAVYHLKGWGKLAAGVKITASDSVVIGLFCDEAFPAGYTLRGKFVVKA